ncbi:MULTISPECIES: DUF1120 domain-containing protein [Buttiauxella]|jgi:hypothetical protein|uniref:Beta-fimbriae major subunit n=1 Tax=Buttiauxella brennerae ATCC 51605 TaxID=1354251 RepID=A0A1B7IRI1_9ENTR|nr:MULTISPECIES: DUF1120 domain-containing protein [Buttiauxella]OAT32383.1 hypothetical protein M975_1518 [Buttiauxella brennerae ATCC 51605]TDX14785.1 uncharacterized protein DUF1120 [Buttiauxella sp. BIGb0552]
MKKLTLAISLLIAGISAAMATETATLHVTGTLTNSACVPTLSNGGVADFGTVRLGELSATGTNQLGSRDLVLTISCDAPSKVAWTTMDNRSDSLATLPINNAFADGSQSQNAINQFGVGKTTGGVNIGAYTIAVLSNVMADGANKSAISRDDGNTTWSPNSLGAMNNNATRKMTVADSATVDPISFTNATFPLRVALAIQGTQALAIADDTQLDGQTTISLVYL